MKTLKYIALSLLVAASTTACKDDPELLTTDVGPEMTVVSADASGVYGGKVDFEVTMTDRYAPSTAASEISKGLKKRRAKNSSSRWMRISSSTCSFDTFPD